MTTRDAGVSMLQNGINFKTFWLYHFPYVTDLQVTSNHVCSCPFFKNMRTKDSNKLLFLLQDLTDINLEPSQITFLGHEHSEQCL